MKLDVVKDKALFALARLYSKGTMAEVAERTGHVQHEMTVAAVLDLNPAARRITFAAPELRDFTLAAPDEFFGLIFPLDGGELTGVVGGAAAQVRALAGGGDGDGVGGLDRLEAREDAAVDEPVTGHVDVACDSVFDRRRDRCAIVAYDTQIGNLGAAV